MHILFYVIGTGLVAAGLIMGVFTLSSGIVFRDPGDSSVRGYSVSRRLHLHLRDK